MLLSVSGVQLNVLSGIVVRVNSIIKMVHTMSEYEIQKRAHSTDCAFHVTYLDYVDCLTPYLSYVSYPHYVNPSSDSYYSNNNGWLSAWVNYNC